MWLAENEGAKFWLNVLTELKNRGLNDILIACVDGLKGFPDAINTVYPKARIQLCIVHMVRNSLRFVSWKDYKARHSRPESDLSGSHRRSRPAGAGSVRQRLGQSLPADKPKLAG
ncbi:putative transposase within prophage [Klebsiella pneumoniae]|uniref:Mutator family transposase n=1 Tax=Klebsiella pneumoniae TaxID=573 RepID=A0A377YQS1_KLEPN|nr:putative transposase within prophage [Klebsiella pneumoniae]